MLGAEYGCMLRSHFLFLTSRVTPSTLSGQECCNFQSLFSSHQGQSYLGLAEGGEIDRPGREYTWGAAVVLRV